MNRPANKPARLPTDCLSDDPGGLPRLLARARQLQAIERQLHGLLEPALAAEVRVGGFENGELVLLTARAGIAQRLRLEAPALARGLRVQCAGDVRSLRVRVAPLPPPEDPPKTPRGLPASAREALDRFARDAGHGSLQRLLDGDSD